MCLVLTWPISPLMPVMLALGAASLPGLMKLLPCPVAYSLPMLGSTFSPALKLTNNANGTSHTFKPKKLAISVKVGMSLVS